MTARDQMLIDECRRGRVEAFGELIQPYQDRLHNTLYRMAGSAEDAAELLQDALIRAFRGLDSYQGESAFYTWLYRIAVNVFFSNRRRRRLRIVRGENRSDLDRLPASNDLARDCPSRGIEEKELRQTIEQALDAVPDPYRAVLVLKDIEGLKYEEIAEVLRVPVGTVRSRLHRARAEMRDRLQPLFDAGVL